VITLIPKNEDASRIEQYRPICLLNVVFKTFTKVGTNKVTGLAHKVVKPTQSAFILGGNILEGVVVLHENIHELHKNKFYEVIFKIDFEKAYDKLNWFFLQQPLMHERFSTYVV
jgi:hypothetical protein